MNKCEQLAKLIDDIRYKLVDFSLSYIEEEKDKLNLFDKTRNIQNEIDNLFNQLNIFPASLEQAESILGEDLLGPQDIKNTFGFEPENIPDIPFSKEELERAKQLDQQLILYIDKTPTGELLSILNINKLIQGETSKGEKFLFGADDNDPTKIDNVAWLKDQPFLNEPPKLGWKLTSKEPIPNSTNKNYLEQTQTLIDYLTTNIFPTELPLEYREAIDEFNQKKDHIKSIIRSDWEKAIEILSTLKITHLTRETLTEVLYRLAIYEKKTGKKSLETKFTWTSTCSSGGYLVRVGCFDFGGAVVEGYRSSYANLNFGVCFSRR